MIRWIPEPMSKEEYERKMEEYWKQKEAETAEKAKEEDKKKNKQ